MACWQESKERLGSLLPISDRFGQSVLSNSFLIALLAGSSITASLVVDADGHTQDENGGSKLLGGPTDLLWLRALRQNANLVVTSGKTYRVEEYRMPKHAHLGVFSRSELSPPEDLDSPERFLQLGEVESVSSSNRTLVTQFNRVHLELGPSTLLPTCKELGIGVWVSCLNRAGILAFCERSGLAISHEIKISDLVIAYCR